MGLEGLEKVRHEEYVARDVNIFAHVTVRDEFEKHATYTQDSDHLAEHTDYFDFPNSCIRAKVRYGSRVLEDTGISRVTLFVPEREKESKVHKVVRGFLEEMGYEKVRKEN